MSVTDIYEAYQENEAKANVTYKERPLNLHFTVDEIEAKYVRQELGFLTSAQLKFEEDELVNFTVGERTNRVCYLDGFQLDTFLAFDCR